MEETERYLVDGLLIQYFLFYRRYIFLVLDFLYEPKLQISEPLPVCEKLNLQGENQKCVYYRDDCLLQKSIVKRAGFDKISY